MFTRRDTGKMIHRTTSNVTVTVSCGRTEEIERI
jgi:hypothetical protein